MHLLEMGDMARKKKQMEKRKQKGTKKKNPPQCVSRFFLNKVEYRKTHLRSLMSLKNYSIWGDSPHLEICADDGRVSAYEGPTCMCVQPPCWAFQLPKAVLPRSMHRISRFRVKLKKKIVRRGCTSSIQQQRSTHRACRVPSRGAEHASMA